MEYKDPSGIIKRRKSMPLPLRKSGILPSPVSAWMTVSGSISALWIMIPFTASWTGMQDIKGF